MLNHQLSHVKNTKTKLIHFNTKNNILRYRLKLKCYKDYSTAQIRPFSGWVAKALIRTVLRSLAFSNIRTNSARPLITWRGLLKKYWFPMEAVFRGHVLYLWRPPQPHPRRRRRFRWWCRCCCWCFSIYPPFLLNHFPGKFEFEKAQWTERIGFL